MTKAGQAAVKVNKAKGTQITVVYCIQSILSVNLILKYAVKVLLRWNPGLLNQIIYSAMLVCHDDNPQRVCRQLVGETDQNASAAGPPLKPQEHQCQHLFHLSGEGPGRNWESVQWKGGTKIFFVG